MLIRYRFPWAAIGLIALAFAVPVSARLQMDRSIGAMFERSDLALQDYRELQRNFGGNAVVMIVYADADLDSRAGFERNREISQHVGQIEGVRPQGILSPSVLNEAVESVSPSLLRSLTDAPPALMDPNDPIAKGFDELFSGYTHSADHRRAAVVAMLEPDHSPATIDEIRAVASSLAGDHPEISGVALVGEPVLIHDGFALIERDGVRLASWTVVLLSLVVIVALVDFRFVLLTAGVMVWSVTVTRAIMVGLAIELSLVSTILTAITTVVTVASVLHLGVRFRSARARGISQLVAVERSLATLLLPIFWTCATDAAGFAALVGSRIVPIRQFGMMIAVAAGCVFVATLMFAPLLMSLPGTGVAARLHRYQRSLARMLRRRCSQIAAGFVSRRWAAAGLALVLMAVAAAGLVGMETETSFLKNFRQESSIVTAYKDVEDRFGGAGVWDVVLDAPDQLSSDYLISVRSLEAELRRIDVDGYGLTKVLSLADADAIAARSPLLRLGTPAMRLKGMQLKLPVFYDALLADAEEHRTLRIMLRSQEQLDANQKSRLIEAVRRAVDEHTQSENWQRLVDSKPGRVTGYYVLMAQLVRNLVRDQWRCFFASGALVWALLWLATRSWRLATAALLPNLLPVLVVLAVVGILGEKINMGAAMIAAVSIGLSIDGSVHFLAVYRRRRLRGHAATSAAIHAAGNIGVPVLFATIALVTGFSVLATSEFVPTATFGLLVAATLLAGTFINLTLLPALVAWLDTHPISPRASSASAAE